MTDDTPFAPFTPQPPMFQEPATPPPAAPTKKKAAKTKNAKGSRRKAEANKAAVAQAAPSAKPAVAPSAPAKRGRKPGAAKKPRAFKVDLASAMTALSGVKPEDTKLLGQMVTALQGLRAPSRKRIVAALGSIFA